MGKGESMLIPLLEQGTPVAFYPYSHVTFNRILAADVNENDMSQEEYDYLRDQLVRRFRNAGISCTVDNKVVFELHYEGAVFYVGFFDFFMSIGLGVRKW
jgi:hypothetical protein